MSVTDRDFDRWQDNEGQVDHDKVAELQVSKPRLEVPRDCRVVCQGIGSSGGGGSSGEGNCQATEALVPSRFSDTLQAGEFFGEYSCLMNRKRACSVTAVECSELYILTKKILELALERWPELSVELYELGE